VATTVYDIKVRYMLDDKASKGVKDLGDAAKKSAKDTSMLNKSVKRLLMLGAGFLTFRFAKRMLIDYNSTLQQARIQMQGLMQMNMGGDWARNQKRANFLVKQFQKDAAASVGTTADFVDMGQNIVGPLAQAGASVENIAEITKGAVIAGKSFGLQTEQTAKDIRSAVFGQVNQKDMLMVQLLGATGQSLDDWNKMAKESPEKAVAGLRKLLGKENKALMKMAEEQGKSWEGMTSTLEDNIQRALGAVGLPLMEAMTKEVAKLTKWFEENPEKVAQIANEIAEGLVTAFGLAKEVFGFMIRHRKLLMLIAKAMLLSKGIGLLTKGIAGLGGMFSLNSAAEQATQGMTGFSKSLTGFAAKVGKVAGILGGIAIGAQAAADWVLKRQEERITAQTASPLLAEEARLLGGGKIGDKIQRGTLAGAEQRAGRLGIGNIGGTTGAERLMAARVGRDAAGAGFVGPGGRINVEKVRKKFGVGDDSGSAIVGMKAMSLAGGRGAFGQMGAGEMAAVLEKANKDAGDAEVRRMTEFLRGLERANQINANVAAFEQLDMMRTAQGEFRMIQELEGKARVDALNKFTEQRGQFLTDTFQMLEKNQGDWKANLLGFGDLLLKGLPAAGEEGGTKDDPKKDKRKGVKPRGSKTNVKIQKIEVVSDDPDRFAFNLVGALEDFNKSPTQAGRTISEGSR
jgi:hypothetical protein